MTSKTHTECQHLHVCKIGPNFADGALLGQEKPHWYDMFKDLDEASDSTKPSLGCIFVKTTPQCSRDFKFTQTSYPVRGGACVPIDAVFQCEKLFGAKCGDGNLAEVMFSAYGKRSCLFIDRLRLLLLLIILFADFFFDMYVFPFVESIGDLFVLLIHKEPGLAHAACLLAFNLLAFTGLCNALTLVLAGQADPGATDHQATTQVSMTVSTRLALT